MANEWWSVICVIAFWAWAGSMTGFIVCAFPSRNVFARRPAAAWGGATVIAFVGWVVAMTNA